MKYDISKCELEIMHVLWREGRPLLRADILRLSGDNKSWSDNSFHILLNSMINKGLVKVDGFAQSHKGYGRMYCPTLSAEEYYLDMIDGNELLDPAKLLALLLGEKPDADTIQRVQNVLDEAKKQL